MNVTDVDNKVRRNMPIICASNRLIPLSRLWYLYTRFIAEHPVIDEEVLRTAYAAYAAYIQHNLPLLSHEIPPAHLQQEVEKIYVRKQDYFWLEITTL